MPKKHTPNYAHTKPSSSPHPSLQSSRTPPPSGPSAPLTVNERINTLRREQAVREKRQNGQNGGTSAGGGGMTMVNQRSIPPALRRILQIQDVDAPRPKPGTRHANTRTTRRAPAGPAAPSSWIQGRMGLGVRLETMRANKTSIAVRKIGSLALVHNAEFEYQRLPAVPSLVHTALKLFAQNWQELAEFEQHYLAALPIPLKEAMVTYLTLYGPDNCLSPKTFKILFLDEAEVEGSTGSQDMRFLDLTRLLGPALSLSDLNKLMTRSKAEPVLAEALEHLSLSPKGKAKEEAVAESWEDEVDYSAPILPKAMSIPRFPQLTRLSLARPGSAASWPALLTLSSKLHTLTHLSLAYWPTPSQTPNAKTTSMVGKHGQVALGGSDFYSEMDNDWHEAANLLRRLSLNTYCLKWLDLEGCTWHKALTWNYGEDTVPQQPHTPPRRRRTFEEPADENWSRPEGSPGPNWAGAWSQIEYLNLFQGWIPGNTGAVMSLPAGVVPVQLLGWLRKHSSPNIEATEEQEEQWEKTRQCTSWEVEEWVQREKVAREVASRVVGARGNGRWCNVDLGWEPVVKLKKKQENQVAS